MAHGIDDRLGRELGLTGRYAEIPAYQIVNDAHDRFIVLSSRLVSLAYGRRSEAITSHPLWPAIDAEKANFAERLADLGGDAVLAAELTEEIRLLGEAVDSLVADSFSVAHG